MGNKKVFNPFTGEQDYTEKNTGTLQINFKGLYSTSPIWKVLDMETGTLNFPNGIQINEVFLKSNLADPATEFTGDLKYCDAQGSGAFPGANPTVIATMDTTTGNFSEVDMEVDIPTDKIIYISLDAIERDSVWSLTINYTKK